MSSKRAQRRRACSGKLRHASQEAAVMAVKALRKKGVDGTLHTYRCQFCGGYHVGHPPGKMLRAMTRSF